jgi:hypothetical protein
MIAVMNIFVTDISASIGRNDFIFDIWLLHGELELTDGWTEKVIAI